MAVKIGSEGTEELINRIATDLGGKSEFVSSAAELGIKMREIMKT